MVLAGLAFVGYGVVFLLVNFLGGGFAYDRVTHLGSIYLAVVGFVGGVVLDARSLV